MKGRGKAASTSDYQIRPATELDVPQLLECLREVFEPYRLEYTPEAYADTVTSDQIARERLRSMNVLVAEDPTGAIVGTIAGACASRTEGHLRGMAVRPSWQGKGVAGALLQAALDNLRSMACRRVTLDTTLPLARAVRFYEKNGFRKSGKVTDFFGMPLVEHVLDLG